MSDTTNPPSRRPIGRALAIVAVALAAGAFGAGALRYNLIESPGAATLCEGGGPWWCPLRQWLVILFLKHAFGIVAVALAAIAVLRPRVIWIALAAVATGVALMIYNADFGALAAVLVILALLRLFGAMRTR
ncbi:MAG: hypothetical protein WEC00_13700 [Dongiaceae bacterium]